MIDAAMSSPFRHTFPALSGSVDISVVVTVDVSVSNMASRSIVVVSLRASCSASSQVVTNS